MLNVALITAFLFTIGAVGTALGANALLNIDFPTKVRS